MRARGRSSITGVALVVSIGSCARPAQSPGPSAPKHTTVIELPERQSADAGRDGSAISRHCVSRETLRQWCAENWKGACPSRPVIAARLAKRNPGTLTSRRCGPYAVVGYWWGIGGEEYFYDTRDGALVAVRAHSDSLDYCNDRSASAWFGVELPRCTAVPN